MEPKDELWTLVRKIPRGRVAAYGALGRALDNPISGFLVGRAMAHCPDGVPWWRVVAKDGRLPIDKVDPRLGSVQRQKLESEGVKMIAEDQVSPAAFIDPELL
jgi:methylated-DNA-protein-cysteine methyltransferase-like protein